MALEMNRIAKVSSCREDNGSAAAVRRGINRLVDGRSVEGAAIAFGAECPHVIVLCTRCRGFGRSSAPGHADAGSKRRARDFDEIASGCCLLEHRSPLP